MGFYQAFFPDDVPRALPAGTLFGSLGRETDRAARVVTADGSEFARIPMPRAPTACFLCRLLGPHYSPKPARGKRAEKGRISYQWSICSVPASFAKHPGRGERSRQVEARVGRSVTVSLIEYWQVRFPWPNRFGVLFCHHRDSLTNVIQVVNNPGGQQLPERYSAQFGMRAAQLQLRRRNPHLLQYFKIPLAQVNELLQQVFQRLTFRLLELGEAIKRLKRARRSVLQDDLCAGNPIGFFAVNEMADDIVGAPRFCTDVDVCPGVREVLEQGAQGSRGLAQDFYSVFWLAFHSNQPLSSLTFTPTACPSLRCSLASR